MTQVGIHVLLHTAEAPVPRKYADYPKASSVEDRVRALVESAESGSGPRTDWLILNKLYRDLSARKPTPRVSNLLALIKPVLARHGYHGVSAVGGASRG